MLNEFSAFEIENQVIVTVQFMVIICVQNHGHVRPHGAGTYCVDIFPAILILVIGEVYSGIEIAILQATVHRNLGYPGTGIGSQRFPAFNLEHGERVPHGPGNGAAYGVHVDDDLFVQGVCCQCAATGGIDYRPSIRTVHVRSTERKSDRASIAWKHVETGAFGVGVKESSVLVAGISLVPVIYVASVFRLLSISRDQEGQR